MLSEVVQNNIILPKTCENSITPENVQINCNSNNNNNSNENCTVLLEQIIPGIYLSSLSELWTSDRLRLHGFTHIIYIDKNNIVENERSINSDSINSNHISEDMNQLDNSEFECLDLNFGETSYLTMVLPSCYKAVKFIDKALKNEGAILVLERSGNQKCVTIVVGYLMYRYHFSCAEAYQTLKRIYGSADLDRFFVMQLYEYEPILQVQRSELRGHSCSGELLRSFLKRRKGYSEEMSPIRAVNAQTIDTGDIAME